MNESGPQVNHCGRTVASDVIAFDIQWEGPLPAARTMAWSMVVTGPDGRETVRLVHERTGEQVSQHVQAASGRVEVAPDADVDEGEVTVRFPVEVVGAAVDWPVWTAVMTADGQELASCVVPLG